MDIACIGLHVEAIVHPECSELPDVLIMLQPCSVMLASSAQLCSDWCQSITTALASCPLGFTVLYMQDTGSNVRQASHNLVQNDHNGTCLRHFMCKPDYVLTVPHVTTLCK